jgi:hypothetical protein
LVMINASPLHAPKQTLDFAQAGIIRRSLSGIRHSRVVDFAIARSRFSI